jgi:hypothetical protein
MELLDADKVKRALSPPENGSPDTPEKKKVTSPDAVTVVVAPEVVIDHCWAAPFCWTNWANVTGTANAGVAMIAAMAEEPTKRPSTPGIMEKFIAHLLID